MITVWSVQYKYRGRWYETELAFPSDYDEGRVLTSIEKRFESECAPFYGLRRVFTQESVTVIPSKRIPKAYVRGVK